MRYCRVVRSWNAGSPENGFVFWKRGSAKFEKSEP